MDLSPELQTLIEALRGEVADLRKEVEALRQENAILKQENAELRQENALLKQENALLQQENALLKQEVGDLRRRLGLDSNNSGKPPSSDGPGKKPRIAGSLRGVSGKKSGGQLGHAGGTLMRSDTPDMVEEHTAASCAHCHAELSVTMVTGSEKRQVFDLPVAKLEVTEHVGRIYTCGHCHGITRAEFPGGVTSPVQYGPRVKAASIYLSVQQLIPEERVAEVMRDLFGAGALCPASLATWSAAKAAELAPVTSHIAHLIDHAPVRHLDETGFRIGGKTQWLHTASTSGLTSYRVSQKRGDVPTTMVNGVIVHDHFKSYFSLPGVEHALCNAHHLRELKALIDIDKEPWAKQVSSLLLTGSKLVHRAVKKTASSLPQSVILRFDATYDSIVSAGLAFHNNLPPLCRQPGARGKPPRRPGHNLLIRLRDFKSDVLRFLSDFAVPFTNNQAEQDIRMMKVKMKISGSFRSLHGAQTFASLRSFISTARKQNWNILHSLSADPHSLIPRISL